MNIVPIKRRIFLDEISHSEKEILGLNHINSPNNPYIHEAVG
jgi:hypothetical protein